MACKRLKKDIDKGSGKAVLAAMAECAQTGLAAPDWLARAYLSRFRAVTTGKCKSWADSDSFGEYWPKGTHLNAVRKRRIIGIELYQAVKELRKLDATISFEDAIERAGDRLGVGRTLAQEYYSYWVKQMGSIF